MRGEGHGRGEEPGSAALMNLPAYGVLNVWKVAAGTGEALPGPTALRKCGRWSVPSYNRSIREVGVVLGGRRRRP